MSKRCSKVPLLYFLHPLLYLTMMNIEFPLRSNMISITMFYVKKQLFCRNTYSPIHCSLSRINRSTRRPDDGRSSLRDHLDCSSVTFRLLRESWSTSILTSSVQESKSLIPGHKSRWVIVKKNSGTIQETTGAFNKMDYDTAETNTSVLLNSSWIMTIWWRRPICFTCASDLRWW